RDAATLTDSLGHVWRLAANAACPGGYQEILRDNGRPVAAFTSCGSVILYFNGAVSIEGDDNQWYGYIDSGLTWTFLGATAPDGNASPPSQPPPTPPPSNGASPSGTRVPRDAIQITDAGGHIWRLNTNSACPSGNQEILRDSGSPVAAY